MTKNANTDLSVAFSSNDPRGRHLLHELDHEAALVADIAFDDIDPLTRYVAGALSFRPDRSEWWTMYQMHPLVQRRRSQVLRRGLGGVVKELDGLVLHGSWFHPHVERLRSGVPFVNYIDQSLALEPVLGETRPRYVNRRRAHALQAETYADALAVLTYSNWARDQTLAAHPTLAPEKVRAVGWGPCGIDLSDERADWSRREPLVLHVSNDFHRKGVDFLVETARLVRAEMPSARFAIVGEDYGGMKSVPQADGVSFVGRISDRVALTDYFRRASVFFLPHRFDRSPHVLVEAMSAALPIVTSTQGGPLELTTDTGAGRAFPIGDVDGYASALLDYLGNPDKAEKAGRAGKDLMRRSYSWNVVARRILGVLREA